MKHVVIVAHPNPHSFGLTMARAYQAAAERAGEQVLLRDLYRMGFDPRMADGEIPRPGGFEPAADVKAERALIADADVFVFVYPLWFNSPPAMLKGNLERIFGMGFAYGQGAGGNEPLLGGRRMASISSSGAPKDWIVETGAWIALRNLFDEHFAAVCGLLVVDHLHFGEIVPGIRADVVDSCAAQVGAMFESKLAKLKPATA